MLFMLKMKWQNVWAFEFRRIREKNAVYNIVKKYLLAISIKKSKILLFFYLPIAKAQSIENIWHLFVCYDGSSSTVIIHSLQNA